MLVRAHVCVCERMCNVGAGRGIHNLSFVSFPSPLSSPPLLPDAPAFPTSSWGVRHTPDSYQVLHSCSWSAGLHVPPGHFVNMIREIPLTVESQAGGDGS